MRKQPFGSQQVSVIGLGTGEFGGRYSESLSTELMDAYIELGGNFIDTARVYGDFITPRNGESEKIIGRWMTARHNRDSIFLSTKGGHPVIGQPNSHRLSKAEIRADMADSLNDLQTDRVDIYWLHRDDENRSVGELMESLQSLIDDGHAQMIGVSNWRPQRIQEANHYAEQHGLTRLIANQPQFSLAEQAHIIDPTLTVMNTEMWQMHRDTQMICCCFSSQAHGFFTKLDEGGISALPENVQWEYLSKENLDCYQRIKQLQQETGLSIGAIALAYLTSQPFPTFALVGASRASQLQSLYEAGEAALTPAQCDSLRMLR